MQVDTVFKAMKCLLTDCCKSAYCSFCDHAGSLFKDAPNPGVTLTKTKRRG